MPGDEEHVHEAPPIIQNVPWPSVTINWNGNKKEDWFNFKHSWENYEIASRLTAQPMEVRVATFKTCLGSSARKVIQNLVFDTEDDSKTLDKIIEKLAAFCTGDDNETYERYQFNKRVQGPGEPIDVYVANLRELARTCNYGTLEDSLIRDQVVIGISNSTLRKRLLQESPLTLKKCLEMCRASEAATHQMEDIEPKENISQVTKRVESMVKDCYFCGEDHIRKKEKCPAWGKTCGKCGFRNHVEKKCKTRTERRAQQSSEEKNKEKINHLQGPTGHYMFSVSQKNEYPRKLFTKVELGGQMVKFQLDSGATCNAVSSELYQSVLGTSLETSKATDITLYNGSVVRSLGSVTTMITNPKNGRAYSLQFQVMPQCSCPVLGAQAIQEMELMQLNFENILAMTCEEEHLTEKYKDVFTGTGSLEGTLHLDVDETIVPVKLPVRKPPLAIREKYQAELNRLQEAGILEPVDEPTDWVSAAVIATKSNGQMRVCIDPKPLNQALKRSHYPLNTIEDIMPELTKAKVFTTLDVKNGFWHIHLDKESSMLTTFGTPWGRFRWTRMPFGISPAPEEFARRLKNALDGLQGIATVADDIIVYGVGDSENEALADHNKKLHALLERCRVKNIKLNAEKIRFRQKEVPFVGHRISADGVKIDQEKVRAIREMPVPTNTKEVHTFLGMITYLQKFTPGLAEITTPLRELIKKGIEFVWGPEQQKSFEAVRSMISNAPVLRYFDPSQQLVLQCDASQYGLGACLLQNGQPIAYASRSLSNAEQNYAQIEKELLAIVFGTEKFETYTYGRVVYVQSDHRPLQFIFNKSLPNIPKRLQRMMLRLQRYDLRVTYHKGSEMHIADALSRIYIPEPGNSDTDKDVMSINIMSELDIHPDRKERLKKASKEDHVLQTLSTVIKRGWPDNVKKCPAEIRDYFTFRDELTVEGDLVFKGHRLIIPDSMREEALQRLHDGHQGTQAMMSRARDLVFWPKMQAGVAQFAQECPACNKYPWQCQQKETLISHEVPTRPWQKVGCDLMEFEHVQYLVTVDYYSDMFEVDRMTSTTSEAVIRALKNHFARYGIPSVFVSDCGPQFMSTEFQTFMSRYEVVHKTSSPYYHQSNGKAENAVKQAKLILKRCTEMKQDPYLALLALRNTPSGDIGFTPTERMFGRKTRTLLPSSVETLSPETSHVQALKKRKAKQKRQYDKQAKDMPGLHIGQRVRVQEGKSWVLGTVIDRADIRSYIVRTDKGSTFRRNRRHIKATSEGPRHPEGDEEEEFPELGGRETPQVLDNAEPRYPTRDRRPPPHLQDYVLT